MLSCPLGMAKHDESIHDEVAFQHAAVDLNSYGPKSLSQTLCFKI